MRPLSPLLLPFAAVAVAGALAYAGAGDRLPEGGARLLPAATAAAAALLGLWFNMTRAAYAAVAIALAEGAVSRLVPTLPAASASAAFQMTALLLPLNLLCASFFVERGVLTRAGLLRTGLLGAQAALVGWAAASGRDIGGALLRAGTFPGSPISAPAGALFGGAAAVLLAQSLRKGARLDGGFLAALAGAFLGLRAGPGPSILYLAAAGAALALAVLAASHALAFRDGLTGLPSRRALDEALLKAGTSYAVAMVDVDHFKRFNDRHGHETGDQVLRFVAARLAAVPGADAFRYGGEEFTLLFGGGSVEEARPRAEELRRAIEREGIAIRGKDRPNKRPAKAAPAGERKRARVTVSIGLAERDPRNPTPADVLKAADEALYRAKRGGRNKVAG